MVPFESPSREERRAANDELTKGRKPPSFNCFRHSQVRRSRRQEMGNGAAKSVQVSQSPMTVLHDIVTGPDPKELVKKWKAAMRGESRKIDRNIRGPVWRVNPLHIRKST